MPTDPYLPVVSNVEDEVQTDTSTVDRVLDTAARLFREEGYAATTTREIAATLGIRQASLYYHIASKEDLLYQIFVSSLKQFLTDVPRAVQKAEGPLDRIHVLIRVHVLTLLKHQGRNVTMLTELRSLSPRHRDEVVKLRERYANFVRSTLAEAQTAGEIRADIPPAYLSLALFNSLNWAARWFREDRDPPPEQLAELFFKLYMHGSASSRSHNSLALPELNIPSKASRSRRNAKPAEDSTVKRLLDAAVALFSRKGYAAASTREVASLLGMKKASLYYHIHSKEDLLYLICKSSLERIRSDVESAIHDVSDPLDRIRVLIVAHVESMLRNKDEHSTTLTEMYALSKDRLAQIVVLREGYVDLVRSVLQGAQKAGALRDDIDVRTLSLSLLGLMNRVLVWYHRGPLAPGQLGELLAVIFLSGVAPV